MEKKVSIIGGGHVGATTAVLLAAKEMCDVVVVDIIEGVPQGKCLDLYESGPVVGFGCSTVGTNDFKDMKGSDVVVMTAGFARKPGMSREDLLKANAEVVKSCMDHVIKHAPDCMLLMVTNPLDVMSYYAYKLTGFPKNRVFGMAGILDTSRFRTFIGMELGISSVDVQAMVLGGHGDSMVPLASSARVSGVPVPQLIPKDRLDAIVQRTRKAGGEIVGLLKTGSAYYAPAAAIVQMLECLLKGTRRLLPVSCYLEGEYGVKGVFIGVPTVLGKKGVEKIVEVEMAAEEKDLFQKSAGIYKDNLKHLPL